MDEQLQLRMLKCLDGLHYSFLLLIDAYQGLYESCTQIPRDQSRLAATLLKCWSIVDLIYRIREISHSVPGLGRKHPDVRQFSSSTDSTECCRHYIQHLRSQLSNAY